MTLRKISSRGLAIAIAAAVSAATGVTLPVPTARAEDASAFDALTAFLAAQVAQGRAGLAEQLALLQPLLTGAASPAVAELIAASRDDAVRRGVETIPAAIR